MSRQAQYWDESTAVMCVGILAVTAWIVLAKPHPIFRILAIALVLTLTFITALRDDLSGGAVVGCIVASVFLAGGYVGFQKLVQRSVAERKARTDSAEKP